MKTWHGTAARRILGAAGWVSAALAASCAPNPAPPTVSAVSCEAGDTALVREVVYFGRNRPGGGIVSDAEWRQFLDEVFTPRFPDGLTVVEATGQWRGRSGMVEQEHSEMVTLLHTDDDTAWRAVGEVVAEYKRRFQQEAVLRERTRTCARFD